MSFRPAVTLDIFLNPQTPRQYLSLFAETRTQFQSHVLRHLYGTSQSPRSPKTYSAVCPGKISYPQPLSLAFSPTQSNPTYTLNNAPLVSSPNFTLQSLCSPKHHISPFRPKQKLAHPPSIKTFPINMPPLFQILIPSPHPL